MEQPNHTDMDDLIGQAMALDAARTLPEGFEGRLLARLRIQAAAQAEARWFRRRVMAAAMCIPGALFAPLLVLALLRPPMEYPGGHGFTDYAASQIAWMGGHPIAASAMPVVWMGVGLLLVGAVAAGLYGLRHSDRGPNQ